MIHLVHISVTQDSELSCYVIFCADEPEQQHIMSVLEAELIVDDDEPTTLRLSQFQDIVRLHDDALDISPVPPEDPVLNGQTVVIVGATTMSPHSRGYAKAKEMQERAATLLRS